MSLSTRAKGLDLEDRVICGYAQLNLYRMAVAKAFDSKYGNDYQRYCERKMTREEFEQLRCLHIPEGLELFLYCPDCDGKFTPRECSKIYRSLSKFQVIFHAHNKITGKSDELHSKWLAMLKYCRNKRVNLYLC